MTLTLQVNAEDWRSATKSARDACDHVIAPTGAIGGLVPQLQGRCLGLGVERLAQEAELLGGPTLAVDTAREAAIAGRHFSGEILVTQPWDPRDHATMADWEALDDALVPRFIRTIASTEALHRLAAEARTPVPLVLQGLTSRHCVGLQQPDLDALLADDTIRTALRERRLDIRGALLNLPSRQPGSPQVTTIGDSRGQGPRRGSSHRVRECWGWTVLWIRALAAVEQSGIDLHTDATTIWATNLGDDEVADLRAALDVVPLRVLRGEPLWLAEPDALQAYATVLAVHRVERGRDVGDSQRGTPKDGYVVVLGAGVAHGVGLLAVSSDTPRHKRAAAAAGSAWGTIGRSKSPFEWAGRRRVYAEPPSATTSLVWLSADEVAEALAAGHRTPTVGDQWRCWVDPDLAHFDRVLGID